MRRIAPESSSPSWLLLGRGAALALSFASAPIVARSIGPEGRGETALVIALTYLLPVAASFGIPFEVRRRWSLGTGSGATKAARRIVGLALLPSALIAWLLAGPLFGSFDPFARLMACLAVGLTPFGISWMCDTSALIAQQRFRAVFVLQVIQPIGQVLGVLVLWAVGAASTGSVLAVYLAGTVLTLIAGLTLVRPSDEAADRMFALGKQSIPYWGSAASEAAANRIDQVLALPLMGSSAAGIYSVAVSLGALPLALGHAVSGSYFSAIVTDPSNDRASPSASLLRQSIVLGMAAGIIGAVGTPIIVPALFGSGFDSAVAPTVIIFASSPCVLLIFAATQALGARKLGGRMTALQIAYLLVGLLLFVVLAPALGAIGAASAAAGSAVAASVIAVLLAGVKPGALTLRRDDFVNAFTSILRGRS